jgi:hypothetical protein
MSCELRFHGESFGWEAQFLERGALFYSRGGFVLRGQESVAVGPSVVVSCRVSMARAFGTDFNPPPSRNPSRSAWPDRCA